MPPTLRIQLIDEFRLWFDDKAVDGPYQARLQSLLAYLALHHHAPQPRHQIAALFWPDSSQQQAQTNLRKLIHTLRQLLPDADRFFFLDHRQLGWKPDVVCHVDVSELEEEVARLQSMMRAEPRVDSATLERIVTLYAGELLPACYEDWVLAARRTLHERIVNALTDALAKLEAQREYKVGIDVAEYLVRLDPLHEPPYRFLMLFRALTGNRVGALRAYHEGAQLLEQELGVTPEAETQELYLHLLQEEFQPELALPTSNASPIPFVGRQAEWQTLVAAWRQMPKRTPQLLLLWGEAGMGKTRLAEELQHWASQQPGTVSYARLYGAEGNLPYAPVTMWLRNTAMRATLAKLEPLWLTELIRLLPELQQQNPRLPLPSPLSEGWQQQRFYEALARAVMAAPAPRLLILDDMQWCDGETLRWLRYLLRFDPQLPLLIIGTVRSEALDAQHPLHELVHHLQRAGQYSALELAPLGPEETATLAMSLAGQEDTEWAERIYAETEGNPLFVVETVRAHLAEPNEIGRQARALTLPSTIQAVIAARLAQLTPVAQQTVQLAATIGRTFEPAVLIAAALFDEAYDEEVVSQGLDELWRRRLLRTVREGYDFSHDKVREVAYAAIAPMHRRRLHRWVAQALESIYSADLTSVWGQLAIHYEQAQIPAQAVPYLVKMAQQAEALDAYTEADAYYGRALALHNGQPSKDARVTLDLLLLRAAVVELQHRSAGLAQEIETMLALARSIADSERLAQVYLHQASYLGSIGDIRGALASGEEALSLYRSTGDKAGESHALRELGLICWSAQEYGNALRYGREALQLHRQQSDVTGEATALHNLAEIYRSLGSPRQAITLYEQAMQLYWTRRDYRRQTLTLYGMAYVYHQIADHAEALRYYRQAQELCEQVGDRLILSRVCHALAIFHWELQQPELALQAINQAVEISRTTGYLPGIAYGLVAQGYMETHLDRVEAAQQRLHEALFSLNLMGDEEGIGEVQRRLALLSDGVRDLSELPPTMNWVRSHVVLTEGKVYCEFELRVTTALNI